MKRIAPVAAALACWAALGLAPARADLAQGARAPDFTTSGALAGKGYAFHLAQALRHGPVVLYFYPKAFTQGCTLEAHAFAEAMADFHKARATVIGLSADDEPTLVRFSTMECRKKFPVATATPAIIKDYDAALVMQGKATGLSSRTSYVIARDGRIVLTYTNMDYRDHVAKTLAAVRALRHNTKSG